MKKFIMGLILGAALSFTVSANAEEIKSLIGKQVDGETVVLLDGVELPVQAAIIQGTTYAPVRAIGEAVGKTVDWKEGKVLINEKVVAKPTTDPKQELLNKRSVILYNIGVLQVEIYSKKSKLAESPDKISDIEQWKKDIADLEAQLKEWQAKQEELRKILPD